MELCRKIQEKILINYLTLTLKSKGPLVPSCHLSYYQKKRRNSFILAELVYLFLKSTHLAVSILACMYFKCVMFAGASSGIGQGTAILFSKLGAKLAITGRNEANLKHTADECEKNSGKKVVQIMYELLQMSYNKVLRMYRFIILTVGHQDLSFIVQSYWYRSSFNIIIVKSLIAFSFINKRKSIILL